MPAWTFVTSHTRILICLASRPGITVREVAAETGITERAAHRVVAELEEAGYLTRHRLGHRNFYEVHADVPLRDPLLRDWTVGDLLARFIRPGHPTAEELAELAEERHLTRLT
jgi:DNA-binding transcriptional ArsR family regulator